MRLNRADRTALRQLPLLVLPVKWDGDRLSYSPFPPRYDTAARKLLVVDKASQAFAAYEYGRLVHWGPVSTGGPKSTTPAGVFSLNGRTRGRYSTVNPSWFLPWYFNFESLKGLAFHQHSLPGGPASHGCVRLLPVDARWVFVWGESWQLDELGDRVLAAGTPVLIVNCYDFDNAPPWRSLDWLRNGVRLPSPDDVRGTRCGLP